jgi:hypothetical protein
MSSRLIMTRGWRKLVSRLSLVALVFAQLALAAHACPGLGPGSGLAALSADTASAVQPCKGGGPSHSNLCHQHCKQQSQSTNVSVPDVPCPLALPLLAVIAYSKVCILPQAALQPELLTRVSSPPPAILYCVFRT